MKKGFEKEQRAFGELGYRLSVAVGPAKAAAIILDVAEELLGWDAAFVYLYSPVEDRVTSLITIDTVAGQRVVVEAPNSTREPTPIMRLVIEKGAQKIIRESGSVPPVKLVPFGDTQHRSHSLMYVPVHSGGETIGILSLQSYRTKAYTKEDLQLLQALADRCGDALQHMKIADALRHAEAKYRSIFENATEGIFQSTPNGRYLSANPALARMLGYHTPEELISDVRDIERQTYVSPQRRQELKRLLETQGAVRDFEVERYRKDGTRLWLSVNARCVRDANSSGHYYEGTNRDITEHKRDQQRLADALELNFTILATSSVGIRAYRASGQCIFANSAAARILGTTPEQLLEENFRDQPAWKESGLLEMAEEALESRKPQSGEIHLLTQSGRDLWLDCKVSAFVTGGELHLLLLQMEITARKHSEEELRRLPLRIIEAEERERLRVSRELHDSVNQIIASAKMRLQHLENILIEKPSAREILRRGGELLAQALEENRRIAQGLRPRDLDELGFNIACKNLCRQFRARAGVALKCQMAELPSRMPPIYELNLFRIIQEALNNIEKHAGASSVKLRSALRDGWLRLEICDDGNGAPPKKKERGLGLTNMRERAAALGGSCEAVFAPRHGTRIVVQVPYGTIRDPG